MKKIVLLLTFILLCSATPMSALVPGGRGFTIGTGGYPEFVPSKTPFAPTGRFIEKEWDEYRADVVRYRREAQEYINQAMRDLQQIQENIRKAQSEANRVSVDYNEAVGRYKDFML